MQESKLKRRVNEMKNHEVGVDPVIESFPRVASHGKVCSSPSGSFAQASTLLFTWI